MEKSKLFFSLILCYSGSVVGAAEPQEATLEGILRQQPICETLLPYVRARDIGRLSRVSRGLHKLEPAIVTAMEKSAIWESHILNARDLNFAFMRQNRDNQNFKDYVLQSIKDFSTNNPGTWINLNLDFNNLGNDLEFLRELLHAVVTTVQSLKIDLASLNLSENQLENLPEGNI